MTSVYILQSFPKSCLFEYVISEREHLDLLDRESELTMVSAVIASLIE